MVCPIRRAADQHEAPIAIAAIDIAMLVDLEKHARMTERSSDAGLRAVTGDAAMSDAGDFGRRDHGRAVSKVAKRRQSFP